MDQVPFRMIALGLQAWQVIQWNFLSAAAIQVPVGNQVMSDAIEPSGKRNATISIGFDMIHCPLKDASREILRIVEVARSVVNIVEDAVYITLIQEAKSIPVTLRSEGQNIIFVELNLLHATIDPTGRVIYNN